MMKTALAVLTMTLMEGKAMSEYTVEVIFEPTGDYGGKHIVHFSVKIQKSGVGSAQFQNLITSRKH